MTTDHTQDLHHAHDHQADPECLRWRAVPILVPRDCKVGSTTMTAEAAVFDATGRLVAITNSQATAALIMLRHNAATEGALEGLSRLQLLDHVRSLTAKLATYESGRIPAKPPVAMPRVAKPPVARPRASLPHKKSGALRKVYRLRCGFFAVATGIRDKNKRQMRCDENGLIFWADRRNKAWVPGTSAGAPGVSGRDNRYDLIEATGTRKG
jgi:hypothetical protein